MPKKDLNQKLLLNKMGKVSETELNGSIFIRCGICGQKFSKNHINRHLAIYHPKEYKQYKRYLEQLIREGIDKIKVK